MDHSKLKSCPNATDFQIKNVRTWLNNSNGAIHEDETKFIESDGDLIPVVPKLKTPLHRFIDRFEIFKRVSCLTDRKVSPRCTHSEDFNVVAHPKISKRNKKLYDEEDFELQTAIYNKESRIDKIVTCAIIVIGLAMLLVPLWLLQYYTSEGMDTRPKLGIITAFLIAFAALFSIVTVARPFEVLAATAAYGAVLMVFMQLQSP